MKKRQWRRVSRMEQTRQASNRGAKHKLFDFAAAVRKARLRVATGDPIPQTPITEEMMRAPVNGQFWREMSKARERVRLFKTQNAAGND